MSATATLSKKFQISVPKAVRDKQHWEAGQEFVFIPKGLGVLMVPVPEQWLSAGAALGSILSAAHLLGFGAIILSGERCQGHRSRRSSPRDGILMPGALWRLSIR